MDTSLLTLRQEVEAELKENILPYWSKLVDPDHGGFYGQVDGHDQLHKQANKGSVLCSRILWTFSSAYRALGNPEHLALASHARNFLIHRMVDQEHGGVFWMVDHRGNPVDTKKQIYAQAFALYGLTEYYRATGEHSSLDQVTNLYHLIEQHSFDRERGGYLEAFDRTWGELDDLRLSDKDANEKKTMNTHLHVLEAYTNLHRVHPSDESAGSLAALLGNFLDYIVDYQSGHFRLFFDQEWRSRSTAISYGHDIEGSWLLWEAAELLENQEIKERTKEISIQMARVAYDEGTAVDGGLYNERDGNYLDKERHWWPQAEAVIGFLNAFQITRDEGFLNGALKAWDFISKRLIDRKNGEWFWSVDDNGIPNTTEDKVGPWKCPYHNGRMCIEVIQRIPNNKQGD